MQKKVGIMTFHNSINYGAVMQTYGLQEYLIKNGYWVEIIDYVNEKIDSELNEDIMINSTSVMSILKCIIKKIYRFKKMRCFRSFNECNLCLSTNRNIHRDEIMKLSRDYDVLITGSDQVWNLNLTNNDFSYFLDFAADNVKKIGYAVSVGDINCVNLERAIHEIRKFFAISVREKSFLEYAKQRYDVTVTLCADPTILAGRSVFEKIASKRLNKNKYIFCFLMESKPGIMEVAEKIAKETGYEIITNKTSAKYFVHSSPNDFLSWVKNAEIVLTDSFHGTVFSILFGKQFISDRYDGEKNVKIRIKDLLIILGIEDCFQEISLENYSSVKHRLSNKINYDFVQDKLTDFSNHSGDWLIHAIEEKAK